MGHDCPLNMQVFESLDHAQAYREYCTQVSSLLQSRLLLMPPIVQLNSCCWLLANMAPFLQVLKQPLADIITLDFKRISGKGIISGASFRVPTLQETHICFGTTPSDQVS